MAQIKLNEQLISVIIPTYNSRTTLKRTIEGLIEVNKFLQIEVIVIDDCSTDETSNLFESKSFSDLIIRYKRNSTNLGVSASRNRGMSIARGAYVSFVDSDDFFLVNHRSNNFDTLFFDSGCDIIFFPINNQARSNDSYFEIIKAPELQNNNELLIAKLNGINFHFKEAFGCLVRREALEKNNICFPESMRMLEDLIFMSQLVAQTNSFSYTEKLEYLHVPKIGGLATSFKSNSLYDSLNAIVILKRYHKDLTATYQKYLDNNLKTLFIELQNFILIFKNEILANFYAELEHAFDWGSTQNLLYYPYNKNETQPLLSYLNDIENDILSKVKFITHSKNNAVFLYCLSSKAIAVSRVLKRNDVYVNGIVDDNRKSIKNVFVNDLRILTFNNIKSEIESSKNGRLPWIYVCHNDHSVFQSIRLKLLELQLAKKQIVWLQ